MRYLTRHPDGTLIVMTLGLGKRTEEESLKKTLFELSRDFLTPPGGLTDAEIAQWRVDVHYVDYILPKAKDRKERWVEKWPNVVPQATPPDIPLTLCGTCEPSELPSDRTFRDAWEWVD